MRLGLTFDQYTEIQNKLPNYHSVCFEIDGLFYIETKDAYAIKEDLEDIIFILYEKTLEEFLNSLPRKPDPSKLREIGQEVLDNFLYRNIEENISSEQVRHTLERTKYIESLLRLGSLSTALNELTLLEPDDMTEPYHWINKTRIDEIINDLIISMDNI